MPSRRDSVAVGGGGGSSRIVSVVSKSLSDSVGRGGGLVAEFFRGLQYYLGGGGGSATNFPLMGSFYIFFLSQRGGC